MNILITGGANGLGESITRKLLENDDHNIFFTYSKSVEKAREIETISERAKAVKCNFKDNGDISALIENIVSMDLDVLINNATTGYMQQHFHKIDGDYFIESFASNVSPVLNITQQVISLFRKKKSGKIINILTSYLINRPPIGLSEYVANKAYLASMSKSWAVENAKFNITSNSISPSFMETGLTGDTDERIIEDMSAKHPLKKLLSTEEVADIVQFFISSSQHINGINMAVNCASDLF